MERTISKICSNNLHDSKDFYISLVNFRVVFENTLFVHLAYPYQCVELGIIKMNAGTEPMFFAKHPQDFYIKLVVEDVDGTFETVLKNEFHVISEPHSTYYGKRRFLLKDPNGIFVEVSSMFPN